MLGTLTAPTLLGSCAGNEAGKATGLSFALNHFGVSENDMQKVLAAALEKGGDYADLFFEHSYRNNIGLQDGTVNRASSNIDFGMGVRVLAGDQTGYAYVENVTLDEMLKAARTAARIANGSAGKAPANLTEEPIQHNYYGVQTPWDELAVNAKTPYLQKLNDQIFALDKRVHKVIASLSDTTSHILFCNSEGQMYYDYRPMATLGAVCIMEENGKIELVRFPRLPHGGGIPDGRPDCRSSQGSRGEDRHPLPGHQAQRGRDACRDGCRRLGYPAA